MTISEELLVAICGFIGSLLVVSWRFSKMQQEQNSKITENANNIAKIDVRTASCEVHQANITAIGQKTIEVESKMRTQSNYNIQTEKQVTKLVTEFGFFKKDVDEMKADIKAVLLKLASDDEKEDD